MSTSPIRFALAAVAALLALAPAGPAAADSLFFDFEPSLFAPGTVHGQEGWSSAGAAGMGCAPYDHEVVVNGAAAPASFAAQSLRISNAVTAGCFSDHTFSAETLDEAGETDARADGMSGGTRQPTFVGEFTVASMVPDAYQPGLQVTISPDRGDGARMSFLNIADTPDGLDLLFYDYQRGRTVDPCGCCPPFGCTLVAEGLDRSVPHVVAIEMDLVDGEENDVVRIFVDDVLVHTGTSWEDYFRDFQPPESRTVDSLLFRTSGGSAPGTAGAGFLFDDVLVSSGPTVANVDVRPNNTDNQVNTNSRQLVPIAILSSAGFDASLVDDTSVVARGAGPSTTRTSIEDVDGDGLDDTLLYFRARDLDDPTPEECADSDAMLELSGATFDGKPFVGMDRVTWLGPACN